METSWLRGRRFCIKIIYWQSIPLRVKVKRCQYSLMTVWLFYNIIYLALFYLPNILFSYNALNAPSLFTILSLAHIILGQNDCQRKNDIILIYEIPAAADSASVRRLGDIVESVNWEISAQQCHQLSVVLAGKDLVETALPFQCDGECTRIFEDNLKRIKYRAYNSIIM